MPRGLSRLTVGVVLIWALASGVAGAQQQGPAGANDLPLAPRDVQRLFDAYVLMQAQERLVLTDQQYPQFLQRLKALQDVRRQTQQARAAIIQELARGASGKPGVSLDEAGLRDRMRRLREIDERGVADARRACDAIDQILGVQQQARFRVFEEQMERRKVELVLRARQGARANRRGTLTQPDR
jgi:hypothetical protein